MVEWQVYNDFMGEDVEIYSRFESADCNKEIVMRNSLDPWHFRVSQPLCLVPFLVRYSTLHTKDPFLIVLLAF